MSLCRQGDTFRGVNVWWLCHLNACDVIRGHANVIAIITFNSFTEFRNLYCPKQCIFSFSERQRTLLKTLLTPPLTSHRENHRSAKHVGPVNLLYIIMFKIRKIKPNSDSVRQKLKSFHGDHRLRYWDNNGYTICVSTRIAFCAGASGCQANQWHQPGNKK